MNRTTIARVTAVLAVAGAIASATAFLTILGKTLEISELSLSMASAILGLFAGMYSMYLARFAKKFRLSRRVFISYSHADQAIAHEIAEALRRHGARIWLDQERLKVGESIREAIETGVENADAFVALLSEQPRPNLLLELGMARAKGVRIIPVLVADGEVPSGLQGLRYIDLRQERQRGIEELVNATMDGGYAV